MYNRSIGNERAIVQASPEASTICLAKVFNWMAIGLGLTGRREAKIRYALAWALADGGDVAGALAELERAAELDPANARVRELATRLGGYRGTER